MHFLKLNIVDRYYIYRFASSGDAAMEKEYITETTEKEYTINYPLLSATKNYSYVIVPSNCAGNSTAAKADGDSFAIDFIPISLRGNHLNTLA